MVTLSERLTVVGIPVLFSFSTYPPGLVKAEYKLKEFPNDANWSFMYEGLKDSVKIYEATNKKDSVVDTLYFFFNDNKLFMARDILKNSVKDYSALTKRYGPLETNPASCAQAPGLVCQSAAASTTDCFTGKKVGKAIRSSI